MPTQPPVHWVPVALSRVLKRPGREVGHLHLVPTLRMCVVVFGRRCAPVWARLPAILTEVSSSYFSASLDACRDVANSYTDGISSL
jgi:hypothetical protein